MWLCRLLTQGVVGGGGVVCVWGGGLCVRLGGCRLESSVSDILWLVVGRAGTYSERSREE